MPEHPLLVFPEPSHAERAKREGGGGRIRLPDAARQAERLAPEFRRLQDALAQKRAALQGNPHGIDPEQVLVLETVGRIENFVNAVKNIAGLEWFGQLDIDDIIPDHGFEEEQPAQLHFEAIEQEQHNLSGQLFLVMTDQQALNEIERLFRRWEADQNVKFPRGLAPLKQAFAQLYNIRPWNAEDRLRETGILADWQDRLQLGQETVPFEAELWFRTNLNRRQQAESYLREVIESLDGEVVQRCSVPGIAYHAILGRIPHLHIPRIIAQPGIGQHVRLLQCENIRHIRPLGQCATPLPDDIDDTESLGDELPQSLPTGDPIVALLDGLPLTGHQKLNGRIVVDDPDAYESAYQARERVHGTAMASLICHGELDEGANPARRLLYARPIMKPRRELNNQPVEVIPDDVLPVDLIHRAIRRLFESENDEPPAAPTVRVINLSVCDSGRPFDREMSPLARLLDWLSCKYNVLFIVSAGNHNHDIELDVARSELPNLTPKHREMSVIKAIATDTRHRRLLSPAETLNALTIGASHQDTSKGNATHLLDPFTQTGLPSVVNAQGPGYRRTIKPDVLFPGGRQFLSERLGNTHPNAVLQVAPFVNPPGQRVATPGLQGQFDRTCYTRGTSNAAALASRGATFLYDALEEIRREQSGKLLSEYDAVLLKALLVHGADWGDTFPLYQSILQNGRNGKVFKDYVGRFLGYGSANIHKVAVCTDQRVTVLGTGKIGDGDADEFVLPLPPSLLSIAEKRRLTITLAWLTPVSSTHQNYRVAQLWCDLKQNNIAPGPIVRRPQGSSKRNRPARNPRGEQCRSLSGRRCHRHQSELSR